jgi:hypothetical protein
MISLVLKKMNNVGFNARIQSFFHGNDAHYWAATRQAHALKVTLRPDEYDNVMQTLKTMRKRHTL